MVLKTNAWNYTPKIPKNDLEITAKF